MSNEKLKGRLGKLMREHLELRRGLGRNYKTNEWTLLNLNQLVQKRWPNAKTVTKEMVMAYLKTRRHLKAMTRRNEVTYIRMFCMDLCAQGRDAYVPDRRSLPKAQSNTKVHIFKEEEIGKIIKEASQMHGSAGYIYPTLIGLLWVTGLRIMEATNLNIEDIDLEQRILIVKRGKFGKSRMIPLSKSTTKALGAHIEKLSVLGFSTKKGAPLFATSFRLKKRLSSDWRETLIKRS